MNDEKLEELEEVEGEEYKVENDPTVEDLEYEEEEEEQPTITRNSKKGDKQSKKQKRKEYLAEIIQGEWTRKDELEYRITMAILIPLLILSLGCVGFAILSGLGVF